MLACIQLLIVCQPTALVHMSCWQENTGTAEWKKVTNKNLRHEGLCRNVWWDIWSSKVCSEHCSADLGYCVPIVTIISNLKIWLIVTSVLAVQAKTSIFQWATHWLIFSDGMTETEVLRTPNSTWTWFEAMTSRSWQYILCPWDAVVFNHSAIGDLFRYFACQYVS